MPGCDSGDSGPLYIRDSRAAVSRLPQWGDASYGLYLFHTAVIALVFIGVRQVHWLVAILGLFAIGMGSGLLYGMLEHRLYGLKARFRRAPWQRAPAPARKPVAPG